MKKLAVLFVFSIFIFAQDSLNLSLKDAFNEILLTHEGYKANLSGAQKAQELKSATNMLYVPNIDLIGNYTYISEAPTIDMNFPFSLPALGLSLNIPINAKLSSNNLAYGILSISYPLFTGGKRLAAGNLADLKIDEARFNIELKKIELFENLVKVYYGLMLKSDIFKVLAEVERGGELHLNNAIKLEENGQIAKIEKLSAQVELDKARNKKNNARDELEITALAFKTLLNNESIKIDENGEILGINLTSSLEISGKELDSIESYRNKMLSNNPTLKIIEIKKEQSEELSDMEFADFLPTIGLYGGYIFKDNSLMLNKLIPNWYVGIGAKLSILSNSGRIFKHQANKIATQEVSHLIAQAKRDLNVLLESTYKEVLFARESHENLKSSVELARENLKMQEEAFKHGFSENIKIVDARNTLSGAIIEEKNAKFRYIVALAKLYALCGDIDGFYDFIN